MTSFWSIWISVITLGVVLGCWWLLWSVRNTQTTDTETDKTMGHAFDGIEELDNPMPKWWVYLFISTCIFALGYLALYPGLGSYKGVYDWTSTNQWEKEVATADEKYAPLYAKYASTPVAELSADQNAMKMGQRLFSNNCAQCHGSSGRGNPGFPNLTDTDWLHGGSPEKITETITQGRMGNMPAKGLMPTMTNTQADAVINYLLSFSGREKDKAAAAEGAQVFAQACAACHGAEAKGNQDIGSPNLTDNIWLYGSTYDQIKITVNHGRQNQMPAQQERLSKDQIHVLAAYVYGLSSKQ